MYKRILAGIGVLGILVIGGSFFANPASALSAADIQAQIKTLLDKVAELRLQLSVLQGQQTTPPNPPGLTVSAEHRICNLLSRNLSMGTSGDDVMSLQEFLAQEGYFSASATGYFGPVTAQAVAKWQSAQGIQSVGAAGPLTRERIKIWCGGMNTERFNASPSRGVAPLTVTFKTNVQLANPQFVADAGDYKIVFGDGTEAKLPCTGSDGFCSGPHTATHTYAQNGSYLAQLVHYGYFGLPTSEGGAPTRIVATLKIVVGDQPIGCTKEYKPVCGSKPVVCITAPCNPIQQTYGNRCEMNADGATFLYEGQCKTTITDDPAADPQCKTWYDGCNSCSRSTPGGPGMCTLMACPAAMIAKKAYCTSYFDSTNKPPVISSLSGPTVLNVNQTGTWTVTANDPENGTLTYKINWGDESTNAMSPATGSVKDFVQTTTFTHAYAFAGTYTVTVVVRDDAGREAKTTATIKVGGGTTACTMEYNPVCGQPPEPACRHSIPACMMATPGPQTYSNRCMMNAAGATFLYEGQCGGGYACTADAMQCPNGTWVGRTGPNCQFVCN